MFIFIIVSVITLLQIFLFWKVKQTLNGTSGIPRWSVKAAAGISLLFNMPFFASVLVIRKQDQLPAEIVQYMMPFFIWQSATLFIALVLAAVSLSMIPFKVILKTITMHPRINTKVEEMKQ